MSLIIYYPMELMNGHNNSGQKTAIGCDRNFYLWLAKKSQTTHQKKE